MVNDVHGDLTDFTLPPSTTPRVSVITVVRNAADAVAETIRSVASQSDVFEHLLIDGASTDDTLERIEQFANNRCRVISEPDFGIYDAMNKGLQLAHGDWLIFMNAGDRFHGDRVVSNALSHMTSEHDVLLGETITVFKDSLETRRFHSLPKPSTEWWKGLPACHQSIFYRQNTLVEFPFNTQYTWCADYDQFIKIIMKGHHVSTLPFVVSLYDGNGADFRDPRVYIRERREITRQYQFGLKQWAYYANEAMHLRLAGPFLQYAQNVLPTTLRLKLRKMRGTTGVAIDDFSSPHSSRDN